MRLHAVLTGFCGGRRLPLLFSATLLQVVTWSSVANMTDGATMTGVPSLHRLRFSLTIITISPLIPLPRRRIVRGFSSRNVRAVVVST